MNEIILVRQLSKQFTEVKAVDDLSFSVKKGEVYGFLGQNGAGKSTTIRMLLTLINPTSGTINIFGKNVQFHRNEVLKKIGAIIEKPDLYKYLTALQNIEIMARLAGIRPSKKELIQQLERVGIAERAGSKVKTFSQGMKQRLGIACALVHDPELIVLDEPTNGLDIPSKAVFRKLLTKFINDERIFLIATHQIRDVDTLFDNLMIMKSGSLVLDENIYQLSRKFKISKSTIDAEQALFTQEELSGPYYLVRNHSEYESKLDIEFLFNAFTNNPKPIEL